MDNYFNSIINDNRKLVVFFGSIYAGLLATGFAIGAGIATIVF